MSWTIVVASSEADQLAELKIGAQEIEAKIKSSGGSVRVLEATSVEAVNKLREDPHDIQTELIILTASLSELQSTPNSQKQPGLSLVKGLQTGLSPACILVSDRQEHGSEVLTMSRCRWLPVGAGTNYVDDCVQLARDLGVWSPAVAPAIDEPYALIEVDVPSDVRFATVRRIVKYANGVVNRTSTTPLGLNQQRVDELIDDSRRLSERFSKALNSTRKYLKWQTDYRALGVRFFLLLNTEEFAAHFNFAKGASAGRDVRLRFTLGRHVFDGLWELIFDPKAGRHLMLDSTITRRERDLTDSFLGGKGGGVGILNVLAIGATVADYSEPEGPDDALWEKFWAGSRLDELPYIAREIEALQALEGATGGPAALKIKVDVLSGPDKGREGQTWSLADKVKEALEKEPDRYDVIHFAGHALFRSEKQKKSPTNKGKKAAVQVTTDPRGFLIFSGIPKPRAVPIATFARWLKGTSVELVYLSCCRSSAAQAAAEFARNSIRTAIGFSWDLDDGKAVDFTKFFYEGLLKNRLNVCSAIREAREKLHNEFDTGDPIWASPVLLAQPEDWLNVEGVLRPPVRVLKPPAGGPLPGSPI